MNWTAMGNKLGLELRLEFGGSIACFQFSELLFDRFQLRGKLVQMFEAIVLRFRVTQMRNGRMNFHERLHHGACGIANLGRGLSSVHGD